MRGSDFKVKFSCIERNRKKNKSESGSGSKSGNGMDIPFHFYVWYNKILYKLKKKKITIILL